MCAKVVPKKAPSRPIHIKKTADDSYHQKEKEHYRFLYNMDRIILQHQHLENH